ncbi:MAG: hypothetical protein EBS79_11300 [Gammaproteobacteria bacterium]|nr:hypothetical protein [Gammaproteobacteria bacterium]NBY22586.1 hypothetical protein [Gammaproteobacteria bacterium]
MVSSETVGKEKSQINGLAISKIHHFQYLPPPIVSACSTKFNRQSSTQQRFLNFFCISNELPIGKASRPPRHISKNCIE